MHMLLNYLGFRRGAGESISGAWGWLRVMMFFSLGIQLLGMGDGWACGFFGTPVARIITKSCVGYGFTYYGFTRKESVSGRCYALCHMNS
jgi:hypothetical protein